LVFFINHLTGTIADTCLLLRAGRPGTHIVLQDAPEDEARREEPARVWLHNDNVTPAEYVVTILQAVFGLGWWKASLIMAKAHFTGESLVGVYPRREAETKVAAAQERARADGWPLGFSVEQDR
jgi:ATP-dependent Clp protease adaptor protein ClpS